MALIWGTLAQGILLRCTLNLRTYAAPRLSDASGTAIWIRLTITQEPPSQTNVPFPSCGWRNLPNHAASIHLQLVDCEAFRPHNFTFLSSLSDSVSPDLPMDAGENTPGQTILPFQVPRSARLTRLIQRALISRRMSARASQPDKLTFSVRSRHNIERYIPERSSNLRFQSTAGEA